MSCPTALETSKMNMIILATSNENYCDNELILNMAEEITCVLFCAIVNIVKNSRE